MKKLLVLSLLFMPMMANADTFGINRLTTGAAAGNSVNLGSRGLEATIARIINVILGFLGVLAIVAIIYGGFVRMTSAGVAEKVEKGNGVIKAGVIGLVIVLAAVAIANFVLRNLQTATGN